MVVNTIPISVSNGSERISLGVHSSGTLRTIAPDSANPYYVGANAYVTQTDDGAIITIISRSGITTAVVNDGVDGADGTKIVSVEPTSTVGLVDTYTITYSDGATDTFSVTNGAGGIAHTYDGNGTVTIENTAEGGEAIEGITNSELEEMLV